jgi:hypothetical protein
MFDGIAAPMLSRLVDDGAAYVFDEVELAEREPLDPRGPLAGKALELSATALPLLDVDLVGPAAAKHEHRHRPKIP